MNYIGRLSQKDPLYGYLRYNILSQLGVNSSSPDFRVYSIPASNHVYLYEDRRSRTRFIGKFFGGISNRAPETAFHYMERMKLADRTFDIGRVAGEIKHFFMQHTGNKLLAEPFIGHFLWEYACHSPDRNSAFVSVTRRLPFHMGSPSSASSVTHGLVESTGGIY
jgi:hypothetical protein